MKRTILSLLVFSLLLSTCYAQREGQVGLCHISGKVEFAGKAGRREPLRNMCKTMQEDEVVTVSPNSSIGITYKKKYLILDKGGNYHFKDIIALMENRQSFNDFLNPRHEFIIRNFIDYYKNPEVYYLANDVNARGSATQSTLVFPADSELVLSNTNLFCWKHSDKASYHLVIVDDFKKAPVIEVNTTDTFARVDYKFVPDHMYYWCVNYQQNTVGFFNTFRIAGDKMKAALNDELKKVSAIPKIDELNRIMISAIVYEDYKCYSEVDRILLDAMRGNKHSDLKLYYGLYLKRRGLHAEARKYLD